MCRVRDNSVYEVVEPRPLTDAARQADIAFDPVGIEIQANCAIIACLLIALWTGKQPIKRTYEMVCWYFLGLADDNDLASHLAQLKERDDRLQARTAK